MANVFAMLFLHYAYHAMLQDLQFIMLAILATRMHRHLWQRHEDESDTLVCTLMSDMVSADNTV